MFNRPFNTVLARLGLVAAILATLLILAPAASAATSVSYPENGTDPVATFSATDEDGDAIVWSLTGRDAADFTIDGGVLAFKSPPNYESPVSGASGTRAEKNVYTVTVNATGGTEAVTVTVTNVDEDGSASLDQYQPQVGRSLMASVSDPDSTPTNQEWQWARGDSDSGPFTDIDGATNPSRSPTSDDTGMYLRASVTYTDSFGSGKMASVVSGRAVEDLTLANAKPSFEGQDQTGATDDDDDATGGIQDLIIVSRSVAENSAVGTAIGDPITATDPDGDVLIYKLDWSPDLRTGTTGTAASPSGDARFSIDRATGQIKVGKKLNYEAASGHVDRAEGGALTADTTGGAIAVTDVTADDLEYVLRVRATDPSGAYSNVNVTISLTDANEAPTFAEASEDPRTAVTVVEGTTDLLQPAETGTEPLAATTFVATDQDTRVERPTDDDTTVADAIVSYALEGADAGNFEINNDSTATEFGELSIDTTGDDAHTPNYEKQSSYSITIVATSGTGDRRLAGRLDVTIKVTNAEDRGSVELSQIEPREGRPVTATLKDEDGSVNVSTWQWQYVALTGEEVCNPAADATNGPTGTWTNITRATSASYTPSDFVADGATVDIANKCLRATATYTDGIDVVDDTATPAHTEPDTATQATDAVVQAAGAVNAAPKFPDQDLTTPGDQSDSASRTVEENTAASTNIGSAVSAGDGDSDLLLYTVGGPDGDMFGINRNTGQITTKAKLDYEALPEGAKYHMVMVTATDPSGATDSIMVTINVTDKNDAAVIAGAMTESYAENGEDPVATFSATDQDGDEIVWSLSGRDAADFTIDGGVLNFKSPPNYESPVSSATGTQAEKNVYEVTVEATGGTRKVVVTVTNVDEDGSASLDQYQPQVGRSLMASVSDPDSTPTNQEWQWARGDSDSGPFTDIDGATNPSRSPTSDDTGMYLRASVTYTDSFGSGKMASVVSGRAVEDLTLANAKPSFEGQDQTGATDDDDDATGGIQDLIIVSRSVAENSAVGTAIGDPITATDPDGDVLIYKLDWSPDLRTGTTGTAASPSGDARFSIDRATGQIKVGKKLNYEAASGHVDRAEGGALTADTTGGAIAVTDVTADDLEYVLRVRATDPSGAYSNVNVTISLTDANEAPTFAEASEDPRTAVTVVEGTTDLLQPAETGTEPLAATTFVATDQDTRVERPTDDDTTVADAIVSYALEGADAGNFEIGNDSETPGTFGQLTIDTTGDDAHTPNYEKQSSYSITIVATSGTGDRRLAGRLDVTIKVTNAEDAGSVELSQIEPREGRPVTATLKDEDGSVNVSTWQWQYAALDGTEICNPNPDATPAQTGPDEADWTDVPRATSASYTPSDFVFEGATVDIADKCLRATATYTDGIDVVDDTATPALTEPDTATQATDAVVQAAGAVNAAPKFPDQDLTTPGDQSDSASRTVEENTAASTNIGSAVSSGDGDGDLLLYTVGGPDGDMFGINRKTGQITTKAKLDYEALPEDAKYHMVMVTATDPSGAYDTIMVTINVTDVNDGATITLGPGDPPAFEANTTSRDVLENMKGANVGDPVTATDAATYSLDSMYFAIDEDTGQITTKMALDYETKDTHVVTVIATNEIGMDSIRVTVTVEDAYPGCRYVSVETDELAAGLTNDCEALLDAKEDLGGSLNWDEETDLAAGEWEGIRFVDGRVAVVWLSDEGLDGTISADLGRLDALAVLNLHTNMLTGSIPMELSYLTMLEELYLSNQGGESGEGLTGGIPAWLNGMTNITELWLWGNDLGGEIPDLSGMSSLVRIKLGGNGLTGGVPTTWPESLVSLNVGSNDLGGGIPDLSGLTNLRYMWLHMNGLTGEIPASIGMMSSLFDLNLRNNMLTGSIPDLSGSESLARVNLHSNDLTGDLSGLEGLTLERLYLKDNSFDADACLPAGAAMAEANDFEAAGLAACQ